jgi:dUTPase
MLTFCNDFGILPTRHFEAAGYDFYIPIINDKNIETLAKYVFPAFKNAFGVDKPQIDAILKALMDCIFDKFYIDGDDEAELVSFNESNRVCAMTNRYNVLMFYLAWNFKSQYSLFDISGNVSITPISKFVYDKLLLNVKENNVGIILSKGDTLMIPSGIREKVPSGYAGVFMNKSGRGSSGYDIRACVIDEDYTGCIMLNLAFTGLNSKESIIYCGDAIIQQLVLPLYKGSIQEVNSDEFSKLMVSSKRKSSSFGSSNKTH